VQTAHIFVRTSVYSRYWWNPLPCVCMCVHMACEVICPVVCSSTDTLMLSSMKLTLVPVLCVSNFVIQMKIELQA